MSYELQVTSSDVRVRVQTHGFKKLHLRVTSSNSRGAQVLRLKTRVAALKPRAKQ